VEPGQGFKSPGVGLFKTSPYVDAEQKVMCDDTTRAQDNILFSCDDIFAAE
jgi:hypothetical protein